MLSSIIHDSQGFFSINLILLANSTAFYSNRKNSTSFATWCIVLFTLSIRVALVQWFTDKLWRAYFVLSSCFEPLFRVLATVTGVTSENRIVDGTWLCPAHRLRSEHR